MVHSLAPALLISMPQLLDPNFSRTVVLLIKHSEEGAVGLVINRPLVTTGRVVVDMDDPTQASDRELRVWIGGPVEPQRSWMLVGESDRAESVQGLHIVDGLYLSTSPDLLRRLLEPAPPERARLILGYSGWGAGQLEAELQESAWLLCDVDTDLVFGTPPERMWEAAIRRLGADPAALQTSRGVH